MLVAFAIIFGLLGMKINGYLGAPWFVVVIACIGIFVFGLITSGRLKFTVERN